MPSLPFLFILCFTPHMVLRRNAEPEDRSPCCTQVKTYMKRQHLWGILKRKNMMMTIFFFPPRNYFMNQTKYFLGDFITRYVVLMPVSKPRPLCFTNPLCTCFLEKQRTATHLGRGLVSFPRPVTSWRTASSPVTTGKWKRTKNYSVHKTNS